MNNVNSLYKYVAERIINEEKFFIGIDGMGGSGKSTVGAKLQEALLKQGYSVILLHIDDFIHPRSVRYNSLVPQWQCYYYLQWRYDYFINILMKIKDDNTKNISVQLYNKDEDVYNTANYEIEKGTIVISEGVFLQRKELQGLFDLMVYIDVPEDIRLERAFYRDTYIGDSLAIAEKYRSRYLPAEHYYMEQYSPAETADLVL